MIFPHTITIEETIQGKDEVGGVTYTRRIVASGVTCFVQPYSAGENETQSQKNTTVSHKIYFPSKPDIDDTKNRFIWVDAFGVERQLKYLAGRDGTSGLGLVWRVDCEELSTWNGKNQ